MKGDKMNITLNFLGLGYNNINQADVLIYDDCNNLGIIGLLPLVASTVYLWFMNIKEVTKFKIMIILTTILWLIYDICIKAYTAALFDAATIIANFVTVYILLRRKIKTK